MSIIKKLFKKEKLPYIEDYYTNSGLTAGYVVLISKEQILHGPDISRSHDKGLEYLLYEIDPNFKGLDNKNNKIIWHELQEEGYALFRLTKMDMSIVYIPLNINEFQKNMINDIISQIENYTLKHKKQIVLVVSDIEQGELVLSIEEFKNYIEQKSNTKHL